MEVWCMEHWFLTFLLAPPAFFMLFMLVDAIQKNTFNVVMFLYNRTLRTIKVLVRGWPPAHLDADGDWRKSG